MGEAGMEGSDTRRVFPHITVFGDAFPLAGFFISTFHIYLVK
jgi:hypothetical protein